LPPHTAQTVPGQIFPLFVDASEELTLQEPPTRFRKVRGMPAGSSSNDGKTASLSQYMERGRGPVLEYPSVGEFCYDVSS
jgi:hypothetical protein